MAHLPARRRRTTTTVPSSPSEPEREEREALDALIRGLFNPWRGRRGSEPYPPSRFRDGRQDDGED